MKRWIVIFLTSISLIILAITASKWLKPFLDFVGLNANVIQGMQSLVQLLLWIIVFVLWFWGYLRNQRKGTIEDYESSDLPNQKFNPENAVSVKGDLDIDNGDFVGHDKTVNADYGVAVGGNINIDLDIKEVIIGDVAKRVWANTKPKLEKELLNSATEAYLQYIHDRHAYLTMRGMGPAENVPLKLALLDLYVPLQARPEVPKGDTYERTITLAGRKFINIDRENEVVQEMRLGGPEPVLDILKKHGGVIILGDPGAGKTTFLKFLALKLARGEGAELGLEGRLPILLPLAAYANSLHENQSIRLDDFIAEYYNDIGCDFPINEMLSQALVSGLALILLDGLDEVKDLKQRMMVIDRVVHFFSFHHRQGNKFVFTSRIVGYRTVRTAAEDLVECTLVDFDDKEIDQFILRWTVALEKQAQGDTIVAHRDASMERGELLSAVHANDGIRSLAANPLLLTILALMKRKGVTLPERRVELYDQYITTLISTWNRARTLGNPALMHDPDVVRTVRILAPLALWMHRVSPGVGLVKREEMLRELLRLYQEQGEPDPENAAYQFLKDVREHAALLLERGPEEYGFIHLTFEEFLAGVAVAFQGQGNSKQIIDILGEHIGDPAWREVAMLAVSYLGIRQQLPKIAGEVVEGLSLVPYGAPGEAAVLAGETAVDAWPAGITLASKNKVLEVLLPAMQSPTVSPELRRRAGLALGKLGWKPNDLDDFVEIAPSKFLYGDDKDLKEINYTYWAAKYPITNLQYARFIKDGGYNNKDWWSRDGWDWRTGNSDSNMHDDDYIQWLKRRPIQKRDRPWYWESVKWNNKISPVVGISWFEAQAFCQWLATRLIDIVIPKGYTLRLPNELEWERAARYTDGREYPWGNKFDSQFANTNESGHIGTTAVCVYPLGKSFEGIWDMCGNIWEWTESPYDWYDEKDITRVVRGGSWDPNRGFARCAYRLRNLPVNFNDDLGFRPFISRISSD